MSQKLWGEISSQDLQDIKRFAKVIDNNNYNQALRIANLSKNRSSNFSEALIAIALWNKYSQENINNNIAFNDISRFVNDNPFFPKIDAVRKNAEKIAVANKIPYQFSKQYFNKFPAQSTESKIYLVESKIEYLKSVSKKDKNEQLKKDIQKSIADIWINEDFSAQEEGDFLQKYSTQLTAQDHIKRINRLLWDDNFQDARRIFYLVNEDYKALFGAIIEITRDNPKYIGKILSLVPRKLRDSEVLAYKVMLWKKSRIGIKNDAKDAKDAKDDIEDLVEMLEKIPAKVEYPEKWWRLKNLYSRESLKDKKYKAAYNLAANNDLNPDSIDYINSQWLAGWIALRFLDKPKIAYKHFYNFYLNVSYPISISRGAYWLGMTSQAMADEQKAISWYKIAAQYPTYFYGQLAIHKHRLLDSVGSASDIVLPQVPNISGDDIKVISNEISVKIAYILYLMKDKGHATKVVEYAIMNSASGGQIAVIMNLVNEIKDKELDVKISKIAARKNVFFIKDKFQIVEDIGSDPYSPLVHAIVKQESGFATTALSSAGAIGFMQLMPATAELVCKQLGIKYNKYKLASNDEYNIKIGSFYIKSLIDRFEGSEIMAIAGYNAGPHNVDRWVREFYDPRKIDDLDKVIDWIELITYAETRNYVQRIMENLIVYKYLMSRVNYDAIK
jgi:soluble lytic murein transglycosylase